MPFVCFSYPDSPSAGTPGGAPAQPDLRMVPLMCFSYTADVPRNMPLSCFSYSAERQAIPDLRRMPIGTCFRY
jgi:hypothetical protein